MVAVPLECPSLRGGFGLRPAGWGNVAVLKVGSSEREAASLRRDVFCWPACGPAD